MARLRLTKTTALLQEVLTNAIEVFGKENLLNPEIEFHRYDDNKRSLKAWNNHDKTYWLIFKTPSVNIEMKVSEHSILNQ